MLKELLWYVEPNRFSNLATELEESVITYSEAKLQATSDDELSSLRENARSIFESHCVSSGLMKDDTVFVNIDAEFFDGNKLNAQALDDFIKEIVKAHCYQKVLWSFMGTTGCFTPITKKAMEEEGRHYEDYLPVSYKQEIEQKRIEKIKETNKVPIYIYPDGFISDIYDSKKATYTFNTLNDNSNFSWNKGYSPDDVIEKKDWYGEYDETGSWVKVNTREKINEPGARHAHSMTKVPIKVIKDGETVILYDPGNMLINVADILFLLDSGDVYGEIESDTQATLHSIKNTLKELKVSSINTIFCGGDKTQQEEKIIQYKKVLQNLVDDSVHVIDAEQVQEVEKKLYKKEQEKAFEKKALTIEKRIESACELTASLKNTTSYIDSEDIKHIAVYGNTQLALVPVSSSSARLFGLEEHEFNDISKIAAHYSLSDDDHQTYYTALANIFANWDSYSYSGYSKKETAHIVYNHLNKNLEHHSPDENSSDESEDNTFITETTLASIICGDTISGDASNILYKSGIPGVFAPEPESDDYIENFVQEGKLNTEQAEIATTAREKILRSSTLSVTEREHINKAIQRALYCYPEISTSTGITVQELIQTIPEIVRKNNQDKLDTIPLTKKRVFFEIPTDVLVKKASEKNYQSKKVSIPHNFEKKESVVILGGSAEKHINEVLCFDSNYLKKEFNISKKESDKILSLFNTVTIGDGYSEELFQSDFIPLIHEILSEHKTLTSVEQALVYELEKRDDVGFNLGTETGMNYYFKSNKFSASQLKQEDVIRLSQEIQKSEGETSRESLIQLPVSTIKKVDTLYKSKHVETSIRSLEKKHGVSQMRKIEAVSKTGLVPEKKSSEIQNMLQTNTTKITSKTQSKKDITIDSGEDNLFAVNDSLYTLNNEQGQSFEGLDREGITSSGTEFSHYKTTNKSEIYHESANDDISFDVNALTNKTDISSQNNNRQTSFSKDIVN